MTSIQSGIPDYRIFYSPAVQGSGSISSQDFADRVGTGAETGTGSDAVSALPAAPVTGGEGPVPTPLSPQILMTLFQFQEVTDPEEQEEGNPDEFGSVEQEFLDYMAKSPEERFAEALLRELGLTPEQLAALPPEERNAILEKIQQKIETKIEEDMLNPVG